jgi:hypothetical protein
LGPAIVSLELANYVGKNSVFMDVDSIALGRDFRESLHESLESRDVVLALIGPDWIDMNDPGGRRRLGSNRILRGGSRSHNPAICRSAYRGKIARDNPGWQGRIGLRVACTL